jgi:hypothetical protein
MGLGKWSALNESLPGRIFISYRRQKTAWPAQLLYDLLVEHFPAEQVFKDVDHIDSGEDFPQRVTAAVASSDVLLAIIGPEWLTITDKNGQRRLDNPEDYIRLEIEAALTRKIRVIPILVDDAQMPRANQLPPTLAPLVRRNAVEINPQTFDTKRLIATVRKTLELEPAGRQQELASHYAQASAAAMPGIGSRRSPNTPWLPRLTLTIEIPMAGWQRPASSISLPPCTRRLTGCTEPDSGRP